MVNTRRFNMKLTIYQHEKLRKNAEAKGISISEYIRNIAMGQVNLEEVDVGDKIIDIHKKINEIHGEVFKNAKKSKANLR